MKYAFARNVKLLRQQRGMTQAELAEAMGVTRQTVVNWESGKMAKPREDAVQDALCELFGVSRQDLLGGSDGYYARAFGLTSAPSGAVAPSEAVYATVPLYGRVHAGEPEEPPVLDDRVPIPHEVAQRHPNAYFLEVVGTCMDRVYPDGCHVLVDPDVEPASGSIAVVSIDGSDFVMRRLLRGKSVMVLAPESHDPQWEDIIVREGHEVALAGTVVWFQSASELA